MCGSVLGFESTEYTLTYVPPICDATSPYSFSPATTATVLPPVFAEEAAALLFDDDPHPAVNSTPTPTIPATTFANLNIVLRSLLIIVGVADTAPTDLSAPKAEPAPPRACLDRFHITVACIWNGCKYVLGGGGPSIYGLLLI